MRDLTSSFMGDMGEESCDLSPGIVDRTNPTKPRVWIESLKERVSWIEVLPGTAWISLIKDPTEKLRGHDIRHWNVVGGSCRETLTLLTPGAAVVIAGATVTPSAATFVCSTATVLSCNMARNSWSCN